MLFKRLQYTSTGQEIPGKSSVGTGFFANIAPTVKTTDANHTLTVAEMSGGCVIYSSFTAGRSVTTPTAALILAAASDMDIGDSFTFLVSSTAAFAATWVAGAGVTLAGRATTPASSFSIIVVEKTSSTTVKWTVL